MNKASYHGLVIDVATGIGTLATISVCLPGTADLATVYSDVDGTSKDNPFDTDSSGRFSFFADPGEYDIQVSGDLIVTYILDRVSILGPSVLYVTSEPASGEHRIKKLRMDSDKKVLITYDDSPEP